MKYTKFADIPKMTSFGSYLVTVPWGSIERTLLFNESGSHIVTHGDSHLDGEDVELNPVTVASIVQGLRNDLNMRFKNSNWILTL